MPSTNGCYKFILPLLAKVDYFVLNILLFPEKVVTLQGFMRVCARILNLKTLDMTQNVDNIIPQIIMITRQQRLWLLLLFTVFFRVIAEGGPTIRGNVYGGGNLADVKTNTEVNISSGQVEGNVYGGGNVGSVGTYTTSSDMKTFTFTANTGECSVTISGNRYWRRPE